MGKRFLKRFAEAPAYLLEEVVQETEKVAEHATHNRLIRGVQRIWSTLGPGLVTGASDDDPSGIATYSQTGAQYGFQLIWLSLFSFPLMSIVQEMCARIGLITGKGLAANIRAHFPAPVLMLCTILLFAANTFNLGADLGAMAQATQLLIPQLPAWLLVIGYALLSLVLQIFMSYEKYAQCLKWLALVLISYVFSALFVHINWGDVFYHFFVPSLEWNKEQIFLICAIFGTTISPYLFFWQTSQEVEEKRAINSKLHHGQLKTIPSKSQTIAQMRVDVWSGMFFSNLAMFFIIATCGATLFPNGITSIATAADAAEALRPFAGDAAYVVFALGTVGVGMLAIPVLAGSSAYAISEGLRWKNGLDHSIKEAHAFYGIIIIAVFCGLGMNFFHLDPMKALISSAVANGLVAPLILICIVLLSSNKKVMGKYVNKPLTSFFGWIVIVIMFAVGGAAIWGLM